MKRVLGFAMSAALLCAAACGNNGGSGNGDGGDSDGGGGGGGNFAVVSATTPISPGTECPTGGVRVDIGLDNGDGGGVARDGTLQAGETDTSKVICNPDSSAFPTLTTVMSLPLGDTACPFGGTKISYGLDNGDGGGTPNDGVLQTGEIDGASNVCLSMPAGLIAKTTALPTGDTNCPYGGELLETGFDDGMPSGVAGDGVLQAGEVDFQQRRCNASPETTFPPPPAGEPGLARIDVSGATLGSGGAGGGRGGRISVGAFGGPLPMAVEVYRTGSVTPDVTVAKPVFTAGAHPVDITEDTDIRMLTEAPGDAVPYIFVDGSLESEPFAWTLIAGDGQPATSLHIAAGVTLRFTTSNGSVRVLVAGDVHNEGAIAAVNDGDGEFTTGLLLECHHFLNADSGLVDQKGLEQGDDSRSLSIWATYGPSGMIYNEGELRTDGRFDNGDGSGGSSAGIDLVAAGTIFNSGSVFARGADSNTDFANHAAGNTVNVRTLAGDLVNAGVIDVSAGRGTNNSGGSIFLYNGPALDGEAVNAPLVNDPNAYAAGGFRGTGSLLARGGINDSTNGDGQGGTIVIRMAGKSIVSNQLLDASGASYFGVAPEGNQAGRGGQIFVGAFAWVGLSGNEAPIVPETIELGPPAGATDPARGSLLAAGGAGGGDVIGGDGGTVDVVLDLSLTQRLRFQPPPDGGDFLLGGDDYWLVQNYDRSALSALTQKPRIRLIGFGGDLQAPGGNANGSGGGGGLIEFENGVCLGGSIGPFASCAFPHLGTRLITNDAVLNVAGGQGPNNFAGGGGEVSFSIYANNGTPASLDPSAIVSRGNISARTGDSFAGFDNGPLDDLQSVYFSCDACAVSITGDIDAGGGNTFGESVGATSGGYVSIAAFSATIAANVKLDAGASLGGQSGEGGQLEVFSYRFENHGTITAVGDAGGRLDVSAGLQLLNDGELNADGGARRSGTARGGNIVISTPSFTNATAGLVTARGQGGSEQSGQGGAIAIDALVFANDGVCDASGGDTGGEEDTTHSGGGGGNITVRSNTTSGTGTLRARGGNATAGTEGTAGGNGGLISLNSDNPFTLDARGGTIPFAGAGAGAGGEVYVDGSNHGPIDARGGNATAAGGVVEIGGANTACISVGNGTIDPADLPNFCE